MYCNPEKILEIIEDIIEVNDGTYEKWLDSADKYLNIFLSGRLRRRFEAEDIVHGLIDKLYSGERRWDTEKYPDFKIFFFMIIKSHISNLAVTDSKYVEVIDINDEDEVDVNPFFDDNNFEPLNNVLSEKDASELKKLSYNALLDDEDAYLVFDCMLKNCDNIQIAEELGVNVKFVENAKKRIRRKLLPIFEEFLERKIPFKV